MDRTDSGVRALLVTAVAFAAMVSACGEESSSSGGADAGCVPTNAGVEECDAIDNDCDGVIDEDLGPTECVVGGTAGTKTCEGTGWGPCVAAGARETCDGVDDDADGEIDENLEQACNTACGSGVARCANGAWIDCDALEPSAEECDGRDNDCDGQIDEDLTRVCEGPCGSGNEQCSLDHWVGCDAPSAVAEICDNLDNDCDGEIDEALVRDCSTACGGGAETCSLGAWGACSAREPADAELCGDGGGDGVDNDCDGEVDEDCGGCTPGTTVECSVDQGICEAGTKVCDAEAAWGPCMRGSDQVAEPGEEPETCDGQDNDCDGATDESFEGAGEPCGTDEGICVAGVQACVNGQQICQGETIAGQEICDRADNDCDGATDEELDPDIFETNETCEEAENIGIIAEDNDPRVFIGSLYPDGDVDYYMVGAQENMDFCVPYAVADQAYRVSVSLSNVPEGVDYDVCITVGRAQDSVQDFCAGEMLHEEECQTEAVDGVRGISYVVEPRCMLSDDTNVLIKVVRHEGSDFTCQPYTVTVWSESVEDVVDPGGEEGGGE